MSQAAPTIKNGKSPLGYVTFKSEAKKSAFKHTQTGPGKVHAAVVFDRRRRQRLNIEQCMFRYATYTSTVMPMISVVSFISFLLKNGVRLIRTD